MSLPLYELDVRPILREGGEPFSAIMDAVAELAPGQSLRLLVTFKPIPLFQVLGARGFEPAAREIGNGDWEVVFTPIDLSGPADQPSTISPVPDGDWPLPSLEIDCRELMPPEPMVKTLEVVEASDSGQVIVSLLPREPRFLFPELEARRHSWRGEQLPDGSYKIAIRRGGRASVA